MRQSPTRFTPDGLPVGTRADIHEGQAQLLTTLVDGEVRAYDCEIVKLNGQDAPGHALHGDKSDR